MASIFSGFGSFGTLGTILKIGMWFLVFLIVAISITAIVLMVLIKKNQTKILEIDMVNKRWKLFNGREKRNKKQGLKQFWAGKAKKFLPKFQQKDIFSVGKQDAVILLKDNNALYHTARIPTWKEMKKWYEVVYGIDLEKQKYIQTGDPIDKDKLRSIYLQPTPYEDLDWLANQIVEADKEFKIDHWWQSPTIAYIGVGFVCFLMIVVSLIIEKKF